MKQTFLPVLLLAAAARGGTPWFDAGIAGLESWPDDGSDLAVAGAGTWRGTESARLDLAANALDVSAPPEAPLAFEPRSSRDFARGDTSPRSASAPTGSRAARTAWTSSGGAAPS